MPQFDSFIQNKNEIVLKLNQLWIQNFRETLTCGEAKRSSKDNLEEVRESIQETQVGVVDRIAYFKKVFTAYSP